MSVDEEAVSEAAIEEEFKAPEQDWLLGKLVEMLNTSDRDGGWGMTLNVGGVIVSGTVIGGREYFTRFGQVMSDGQSEEHRQAVEDYFGGEREWYGPEGSMSGSPGFIHMRDARFYSAGGNPIPGNQGLLWRARIAAVDAFSIGVLSVAKD